MNAVRQSCRPKHQVLILKCYPKCQKGALDVRPNASELSYLLYYASTRRSKVQKVGAFLAKRTARDVWRGKTGNVIVTLHILHALIEKCPADLPLYADAVLTILDTVLRSNDLALVEHSVRPFAAFCASQDPNLLAAEHAFVSHYRDVVRTYASFAADDPAVAPQTQAAAAAAAGSSPSSALLRWKTAGLRAIQAVVSIDDIGTDVMNQLDIVLPALLETIYAYSFEPAGTAVNDEKQSPAPTTPDAMRARIRALDDAERELARCDRRKSLRTIDSLDAIDASSAAAEASADASAAAAAATEDAAAAQSSAETAVRALALACLQRIYATASNTGHIRHTTAHILRFIVARQPDWAVSAAAAEEVSVVVPPGSASSVTASAAVTGDCDVESWNWGRHLLCIIARATPVQNRFIILLAAMEALLNTPLSARKLPAQLLLASLVDGLLAGPSNLIGLSVMDVLIGLLQHLLLLLRVGTGRTRRVLHRQATSGFIKYSMAGVEADGAAGRGKRQSSGLGAVVRRRTLHRTPAPSHPPTPTPAPAADTSDTEKPLPSPPNPTSTLPPPDAARRAELARLLQLCIGHLATHIYYADQVSDTVATILARVRPAGSAADLSDSSAPPPSPHGSASPDHEQERLFAFPEAQRAALSAVRNVLGVANSRFSAPVGGGGGSATVVVAAAEARNRVSIAAWEDTQWMLGDADAGVRRGYVEALVAWLEMETTPDDLRAVEPRKKAQGGGGSAAQPAAANNARPTTGEQALSPGNPAESSERLYRTIANTVTAVHRDRAASVASQFLSLLHVAIYDAAAAVSDADANDELNVLRLHLVLATLVDRLGVNAIRHGLPMVMRLQEQFVAPNAAADGAGEREASAAARVMIGSLVHGYLLAIVRRYDLHASPVGRDIIDEVEQRKSDGCWARGIAVPPLSLRQIDELAAQQSEKLSWTTTVPPNAALHPFTRAPDLADAVEQAYNATATHPFHPSSLDGTALGRPTTGASTHSRAWQQAYHAQHSAQPLPPSVKACMTAPWVRDAALAALDANGANTPSLGGSRTTTNLGLTTGGPATGRAFLADAFGHRHSGSPTGSVRRIRAGTTISSADTSPSAPPADASVASCPPARRSASLRNGLPGAAATDDHRLSVGTTTSTIRMNVLRHALSVSNAESHYRPGAAGGTAPLPRQRRRESAGYAPADPADPRRASSSISSVYSDHPSLISAHSAAPPTPLPQTDAPPYGEQLRTIDSIPPVPPIPTDFTASATSLSRPSTARAPAALAAPPQQGKTRSNTVHGSSAPPPPALAAKRAATAAARVASGPPVPAAQRARSIRSNRTLSLGRRADVERLINGLLEHANSEEAGEPLDDELGEERGGEVEGVRGAAEGEGGVGGAREEARAPQVARAKSHLVQQREQRAALLAGLGGRMGAANRENVVRPPY